MGRKTRGGPLQDFLASCVLKSGGLTPDRTEQQISANGLCFCSQSRPTLWFRTLRLTRISPHLTIACAQQDVSCFLRTEFSYSTSGVLLIYYGVDLRPTG